MADRTPEDGRLRELMRGAQLGDAAAYRELLEIITVRVRQVVRRRRGFAGPEAVEDLVQDVLLSVHAVRATYDPEVTFADLRANTIPEEPAAVEALTHAIGTLPPGQRQAIELLKLREMSLKEAAAAMFVGARLLRWPVARSLTALS